MTTAGPSTSNPQNKEIPTNVTYPSLPEYVTAVKKFQEHVEAGRKARRSILPGDLVVSEKEEATKPADINTLYHL